MQRELLSAPARKLPIAAPLAPLTPRLLPLGQASALAFSRSNSAGVIEPPSRSAFGEAIWSVGLDALATDLMY